MSRNLCANFCAFCTSAVALDEAARPIRREEARRYYDTGPDGYGYAGMSVANASCTACGAKYLAWIDLSLCAGYGRSRNWGSRGDPFFDLSHRSTFNDEPGEEDLPDYDIVRVCLTEKQCAALECMSGVLVRRAPWPRCPTTGRKVWHVYGCDCGAHR